MAIIEGKCGCEINAVLAIENGRATYYIDFKKICKDHQRETENDLIEEILDDVRSNEAYGKKIKK